ncbi:MAG TPA: hypothetical protein VFA81_11925 [Burkholderiales bacterium]|nr:hypothetical protein [Burkholderiales bacterium]
MKQVVASTERNALYTSGPWQFEIFVSKPDGGGPPIWRVFSDNDSSYEATLCELWSGEHDNEANARLIAAAPDLLAACEEFVRKVNAGEARSTRSYRQMKAAIAKARGK